MSLLPLPPAPQRRVTMIALAVSMLSLPAAALAIEAPIQSVTLYPGSATVERVVRITPGMTQVEITGLTANFSTETLRLQADPGIQVGQVATRDQGRIDSPNPRAAELEAKIQALQDQVALIDADTRSAQLVQAYLERIGGAGKNAEPGPALDQKGLLGTLDAIRKAGMDALKRIHDGEIRKRALTRQLGVLKGDLAKVQAKVGANERDSRTLTVQVAARQAGKLILSYQVNRAGWKPAYRASLDSSAASVELERMATVSQKTGEDWSGVKLRLSTGQPNLSAQAPDPQPWLLRYEPPQEAAATAQFAPVQVFARRAAAPAPPPPPAPDADDTIAPVLESQGTFTTEYEVPARVELAADGREITVALTKTTLPVSQRIRIAPRIGAEAVVTAEAARPEGVWLAGQVQLRRDGAYVGALHWNPQDNDRLTLAFGRDPLVRVAVEQRGDKAGQAGIFRRSNARRIADTYVITNSHRQPVEILVLEPAPVSESDQVRVKTAFEPAPNVKDWQGRRGLVGWERTLRPNETLRLNVDYAIDYPDAGSVRGLP